MGRYPDPASIHRLRCTRSRRGPRPDSPRPPAAFPTPPDDLSPRAREVWERWGELLVRRGVLTELDAPAFEVMVRTWERWQRAVALVDAEGPVALNTRGRPAMHPAFRVQMQLQAELTRLFRHFGLTPATRASITTVEPEPDENDPVVRWMRGLSAE
jgi:P27 family predicted phage terminase small subunit